MCNWIMICVEPPNSYCIDKPRRWFGWVWEWLWSNFPIYWIL